MISAFAAGAATRVPLYQSPLPPTYFCQNQPPLVIAQEQGVARILVAEVEAETVRGTSLRGLDLDGELSSPSQVNRLAANGDSRIATAAGGIAVGGGGLEMSPSRIIASAGCKNFAAFGGVAVNRPAVHGSIVRDGGDIVGVRVIGASR